MCFTFTKYLARGLNLNRCLICQSGFWHQFPERPYLLYTETITKSFSKVAVVEKDTKNFVRFKSFCISKIMAEHKRIMAKCQELGL